ncbi:uncharacterized protein LOC144628373 [Oculina patagonica]
MSKSGKRKHRKSSDTSQPSISPDSKLSKMKGEEFNMATDSNEAVNEDVPSLGDIWRVLLQIKENTNHLNEEFEQLKTSFALQDKEISKLKETNSKLFEANTALSTRIQKLKDAMESKDKKLKDIFNQQDSLEQYTRKNSLEIIGVPVMEEQSCEDIVLTIASKLEVDLRPEDIEISHRLKRKGPEDNTTSAIIVKFVSHKKKTELYRARVKLKVKSLRDFFPSQIEYADAASRVFINENLTYARRKLLAAALKKKRKGELHSVWTLDGKIFAKTAPTSRPTMITSLPEEREER